MKRFVLFLMFILVLLLALLPRNRRTVFYITISIVIITLRYYIASFIVNYTL